MAAAKTPFLEVGSQGFASDEEALQFLENVTQNADAVQEELLSEILLLNSDTEYMHKVGLGGCRDTATFKKLAPLVTYEDILPYIQRIADGDKSPILSSQPISGFLTSSGTSGGKRKLIPTVENGFEKIKHLVGLGRLFIEQQCSGKLEDGKGMRFLFVKPETKMPSGLSAKTAYTSILTSKRVQEAQKGKSSNTSPLEAMLCEDVVQSMYSQVLCGLVQRGQVESMGSSYASSFLRVVKFLCERWSDLAEDIRQRKLVSTVVTEANLCNVVEAIMASSAGAGPAAAAEIESECKRGSWEGILRRLWPRAKYVEAIVTGPMAQYIPMLEFFAGGIPIVSATYACSECLCGWNLTPFCPPSSVCYTMIPTAAFFEFLPLSEKPLCSNLVDLVDVQVGMEYELVVTTVAGLYRYRVGDVLKVEGFHNKSPQFSFLCRKDAVLTIDTDKTDEDTLQRAVKAATTQHLDKIGWRLAEFSSYAEPSTIPGHYVLFWELSCNGNAPTPSTTMTHSNISDSSSLDFVHVFEDCCLTVENCLDTVYRQGRVFDNSIGPLEIRLVQSGSFDALMDYCIVREASVTQYKTPLCIKSAPLVELLNSRVTHCFFSPKCPTWTHTDIHYTHQKSGPLEQ